MSALKKIPIERLPELRDSYKVDYPLHISTISTIQLFIDRFAKYPQWIDRVSFWSLNDDWHTCGAFIMTHDYRIYFNTLEDFPFDNLRKALIKIDLKDDITTFVNIRDELRPLLIDVIRVHHCEIISDFGSRSYRLEKDALLQLELE